MNFVNRHLPDRNDTARVSLEPSVSSRHKWPLRYDWIEPVALCADIATILLAAIVGAILWLVFTLRDKVVPLLETLSSTATRVKGTTEFMTEQAVSPVIQAAGAFAKFRAVTRVATGGKKRPVARKRKESKTL